MSHPEDSRRKSLEIAAVDPVTGKTTQVFISYDRLQIVGRRGMGHAKEAAYIVPQILQQPAAIFEGLRRDEDEDRWGEGWRCYCGIPTDAYHLDGSRRSPYLGQVFLVFVNSEHIAYNWRWELADPDNLKFPKDHEQRFKTKLL